MYKVADSHREHPVVVADDQELFRSGLAAILKREFGFTEIIEAGSLDATIAELERRDDIALATIDISMLGVHSGTTLQSIRQSFPHVLVAVLTGSSSRGDILTSLAAGVHGYIPKTLGIPQIADAIRRVLEGEIYVPAELARLPEPGNLPSTGASSEAEAVTVDLTPRQRTVLECIAQGKSNREIASALGLTESTVKVHVHAVFRALEVNNRTSAAAALARFGRGWRPHHGDALQDAPDSLADR